MSKRISFIALALIIAASSLMAQPKRPDPKTQALRLKTELALTDEQTSKVEKILTDSQAKFQEQSASTREERQASRAEYRKLMDETHAEINKILNDEQKVKFEKFIDERRENMGQGRRNRGN